MSFELFRKVETDSGYNRIFQTELFLCVEAYEHQCSLHEAALPPVSPGSVKAYGTMKGLSMYFVIEKPGKHHKRGARTVDVVSPVEVVHHL